MKGMFPSSYEGFICWRASHALLKNWLGIGLWFILLAFLQLWAKFKSCCVCFFHQFLHVKIKIHLIRYDFHMEFKVLNI